MNILHSRVKFSSAVSALLWVLAFFTIAIPLIVFAQQGLVPCGTVNVPGQPAFCTICDLFVLLQRLITYVILVVGSIAALFLAYGGLLLLLPAVGAGGSGMYQRGKTVLTNTVIGIVIIFLSWVIVDTIMKAFVALNYAAVPGTSGVANWMPWHQIFCEAPRPEIPTPIGATHADCFVDENGRECIQVQGAGPNKCSNVQNCIDQAHNECQPDKTCKRVPGLGEDKCDPAQPTCNVSNQCTGATCPDSGTNFCAPNTAASCSDSQMTTWDTTIESVISRGSMICGNVDGFYLLKAIMSQESSGIIPRTSSAGACGLMQLKPGTANGYKAGCTNDNITCDWLNRGNNAKAQICIALNLIKASVGVCGCDVRTLAAGYNGDFASGRGPCALSANCGAAAASAGGQCQACSDLQGPTQKWQCLWSDNEHKTCDPAFAETRAYVPKVYGCYQKFGGQPPPPPPPPPPPK